MSTSASLISQNIIVIRADIEEGDEKEGEVKSVR